MKKAPRITSLVAVALGLASCGSIAERDRGMLGRPSPAVAMYAAQVQFAHDMCKSEGYLEDPVKSERFVTMSGNRGLSLSHYLKNYPDFVGYLEIASVKYQSSRARMSQAEKARFCSGYNNDISKNQSAIAIVQKSMDFQKYFSPPTDAFLESSQQGAVALAVLSVGASVAGIQQTNKGNFSASESLNQVGGILADGLPGSEILISCAAYTPFTNSDTPAGNQVWRSYNSIQDCS